VIARLAALLLALGSTGACRVGAMPVDAPAHGNMALLAESSCRPGAAACDPAAKTMRRHDPLVVLIEERGLRAVEPDAGLVRWWRPLPVVGHPVADASTVFVPLRGHELAAVDRRTGEVRFRVPLPGEALTGLAVAGSMVIATVVGTPRGRSEIVALSGADGRLRWTRPSDARLGTPAANEKVVWVPQDQQVVGLHRRTGREVARIDLPAALEGRSVEQMSVQDRALVAGGKDAWFDMRSATNGRGAASHAVEPGYADVFALRSGMDPGYGDDERTRMWIGFPDDAGAPRDAVLLGRRAVVSFRLGPDGVPSRARWAWLVEDRREVVALDVGAHRVSLIREDGSLVVLCRSTGEELDRLAGGSATRGALLLDMGNTPVPGGDARRRVPDEIVRGQLMRVLQDTDPRLVPAQKLVARVLWRADDPDARRTVRALARGELRGEPGEAADVLRAHALELTRGAWGADVPQDVQGVLLALSRRPSFARGEHPVLAPLAREVARSGHPEMVPHLVEHLLHPATRDTDLTEIASALVAVAHPSAVEGVATFVRRYHADAHVVYASKALQLCIDYLAAQADAHEHAGPEAKLAQVVLEEVWRDPFTEPSLRAYVAPRLSRSAAPDTDDIPPELPAVSHLGL
jgi:hypothetical protein